MGRRMVRRQTKSQGRSSGGRVRKAKREGAAEPRARCEGVVVIEVIREGREGAEIRAGSGRQLTPPRPAREMQTVAVWACQGG